MRNKKKTRSVPKWHSAFLGQRYILMLLAVASLLGQLAKPEERSIMTGAITLMSDINTICESYANMIGKSFKAYMHTSNDASPYPDFSKWYRIELTETQAVVSIQVVDSKS